MPRVDIDGFASPNSESEFVVLAGPGYFNGKDGFVHKITLPYAIVSVGLPYLGVCRECRTPGKVLQYGLPENNQVVCTPNLRKPEDTAVEAGGKNTEGGCNLARLLLTLSEIPQEEELSGD